MYLSDDDLKEAIENGSLIFEPKPKKIDPTSIDVHLGDIDSVKVWDSVQMRKDGRIYGNPEMAVHLGSFDSQTFSTKYLIPPRDYKAERDDLVMRHGSEIVLRPNGFLLWMTKETIGTPNEGSELICFVDGKSTRARTGIVVHMTAPTIHGGWNGPVALEIKNLGELTFRLSPGDAIAQITVARLTKPPTLTHVAAGSVTYQQKDATGKAD